MTTQYRKCKVIEIEQDHNPHNDIVYIVSSDSIRVGDVCIVFRRGKGLVIVPSNQSEIDDIRESAGETNYIKAIASSAIGNDDLPNLPFGFYEDFEQAHHDWFDVLFELKELYPPFSTNQHVQTSSKWVPKLDEDGSIIGHVHGKTYNREEVVEIAYQAMNKDNFQ